jgi:ubiquinone biosynthesis protein
MGQAAPANGAQAPAGRRRTVEERLRAAGAARRPAPPEGRLGKDEHDVEDLRDALQALGPIFASFGLYLASRVDILSRRTAAELGKISTLAPPSAPAAVAMLIRREMGAAPGDCFHMFDPEPIGSDLLFQIHTAWLPPSIPVVVRIVRPEIDDLIASDLPLLSLLERHLPIAEGRLDEAIDDFGLMLQRKLNQIGQADFYTQLALDRRAAGALDAPICYRDQSTPHVLTMERVDGVAIGYAFREGLASTLVASGDRESTIRRLCAAWLRQAVEGRVIPTDFGPHDVVLQPNRMVYVGTGFEPQTADGRVRFLSYVGAVAGDDPDTACELVVGESEPRRGHLPVDDLKRRFRQAVPFRDGESSGGDSLGEQLLVQWRVAAQSGWRVQPHLLQIYRGVQALTECAGALAPGKDVLMLAFQDVRLHIGLNEAQQLLNPLSLPATLDSLLANMVNLPQKLDEVLTLAAEGRLRVKLNLPASQEQRRLRNQTVSLIAGLSVMVSLAFLFRLLVPDPGVAAEQVGAVALLAAGLWLLNAARTL